MADFFTKLITFTDPGINWPTAIIVVVCSYLFFLAKKNTKQLEQDFVEHYQSRPFVVRQWYRMFPDASKREFREFLFLLKDEFGLTQKQVYGLSPGDHYFELEQAGVFLPDDSYHFIEMVMKETNLSLLMGTALFSKENCTLGNLFKVLYQR